MYSLLIRCYLVIGIAILFISTSAIFVKLSESPAGVIAFYRLLFSVLIIAPVFVLTSRKEKIKLTKESWIYSILAGVLLAFHFILWFESLRFTSVTSSTVMVTLQPIFAVIGAYLFFKEKATLLEIGCVLLALAGSFIIGWNDLNISGQALFGDALALLACLFITVYLLCGQRVRGALSVTTYTFIVYSVSTVTLFIYVISTNQSLIPISHQEWIYFILLAIFPTLLGHSLLNWSLKFVSTTVISMAILFEPIGAAVLAYLLLNEKVSTMQVVGSGIIFLGVSLYLIQKRKNTLSENKGILASNKLMKIGSE
ncbi:DMT family transporter [Metabacillus iocasae]|uniref:Drug/metabolite transporter (DMT)-like permease n=1 Tax=Priestia iocasae TaxID=2291674 RepID=A0ABS2QYV4_9BACI|nr:drug/metabolite transporter (DMT)-like permease [Metabacillus iocasae]